VFWPQVTSLRHSYSEPLGRFLKKLTGSICALATPFRDGALDLDAYARLLDYQISGGTQALVVAGSTGEAHALDQAEYDRLLGFAVRHVRGRVPVLAGTGTANTHKTILATQRAKALGADAALVVTPYYVRPTQSGLVAHYRAVADQGGLPIVLYNVPGRTGCDMLPETVAQLAGHERIVGVKEARGDAERAAALIPLKSPSFAVLSGDDPTAMRSMLDGADGVISVAVNAAPAAFRALCDAALAGDRTRAAAWNERLTPLYDVCGIESNPIPVKWCLSTIGIGTADLRLPMTTLSAQYHAQAQQVLADLGLALPAVQPLHSSAA